MRISEAENKRIIKEIKTRRIFYNQILNNEKGEEELDNEDVFKIAREQLYNEIWELSVSKVAKKYNLSHTKLKQACIDANIPTPSNSYWTNLAMGNTVAKTPLPLSDIKEVILQKSKQVSIKVPILNEGASPKQNFEEIFKNSLLFLESAEKSIVLDALSTLNINNADKLHPKVILHERKIKAWKQTHSLDPNASRKRDTYYRPPEGEPFLYRDVSELSLPRIYKILSTLFKCVESLGGSVNEDLTLTIRNEVVRYKITEAEDKIPHVLTKEEQKAMEQYERDRLTRTYAYKPNIRKWDYIFNGKLRFSVLESKHYRDGDSMLIEQRLPEMLIDLYEESENVRIQRIAHEAAVKKAEEERKLKERRREMYNEEVERVVALENEAEDYALACKIRAYVSAVESQPDVNEKTREWIKWAKEKAGWYDPIISKDDELLGQRNHQQDKEQKLLKKKYSHFW